jgi:hypothetical protein
LHCRFRASLGVRYTLATPSYAKDSSFRGCAVPPLGGKMIAKDRVNPL